MMAWPGGRWLLPIASEPEIIAVLGLLHGASIPRVRWWLLPGRVGSWLLLLNPNLVGALLSCSLPGFTFVTAGVSAGDEAAAVVSLERFRRFFIRARFVVLVMFSSSSGSSSLSTRSAFSIASQSYAAGSWPRFQCCRIFVAEGGNSG